LCVDLWKEIFLILNGVHKQNSIPFQCITFFRKTMFSNYNQLKNPTIFFLIEEAESIFIDLSPKSGKTGITQQLLQRLWEQATLYQYQW